MPLTQDDLNQFHEFAVGRLSGGDAESLSQLAAQWEAQREYDETVKLLQDRTADMEAGIGRPLTEVDEELRAKHGFQKRQHR